MFKYLFLIFTSGICMASEPKLHYMDCVKIIEGFYKDCHGKVTDYYPADQVYTVNVQNCKGSGFTHEFDASRLEACKK